MKVVGIIPARLMSTRLQQKPLVDINGKYMIQHVYERALKSNLDDVIVACDDIKVFEAVTSFGGKAMMTSKDHLNGSSRIAEVAKDISADYVINIQGDEPLITPILINEIINAVEPSVHVVTVKQKLIEDKDIDNPNCVKVITDLNNNAIYFSRSRIPFNRENFNNYYKHIGIYCYQKDFLMKYVELKPSSLELAESLEQLRIIENGYKLKVIETTQVLIGVDTEEDLAHVRKLL